MRCTYTYTQRERERERETHTSLIIFSGGGGKEISVTHKNPIQIKNGRRMQRHAILTPAIVQ